MVNGANTYKEVKSAENKVKIRSYLILAFFIMFIFLIAWLSAPNFHSGYKIGFDVSDNTFYYETPQKHRTFMVFLGGDVENEGFFEVVVGVSYGDLFTMSGFNNVASYDINAKVFPNYTEVQLPIANDTIWPIGNIVLISGDCVNINFATFSALATLFDDEQTAQIVVDYIAQNGKTNNKYELLNVLTEEQFDAIKNKIYALRV